MIPSIGFQSHVAIPTRVHPVSWAKNLLVNHSAFSAYPQLLCGKNVFSYSGVMLFRGHSAVQSAIYFGKYPQLAKAKSRPSWRIMGKVIPC